MIAKIKNKAKEILLWSQRYTKTDMIYLARGGFWLSLGDVMASASSFVMAVVFANLIPQEVYGTYKYVISVTGVLGIFSLSGIGPAITKSVAQGFEGSFIPAIKTSVKWAALGSIASVVVATYYYLNGNQILGACFLLVAAFIPFRNAFSFYQSYLEGKQLFNIETQYSIIGQIIGSASIILTLLLSSNIILILFSYFAPQVLINLYFLIKITKKISPSSPKDPQTISYGKDLSILNVLVILSGEIDKILLWKFLGAPAVAVYTFATAPVSQIRGFLGSIGPLAFPKLAERKIEGLRKNLPGKIILMLGIIGIISAVYIFAAPFLFKIFFPKYLESIIYSQVFAIGLLILPRNLISDSMVAHSEKRKLYILSFVNTIFRLALMFILIKLYGIWGAIITFLVAGFFGFGLAFYLFKRP